MALTRLDIYGYRGFRETQHLNFAVPCGIEGGGLTVLTGPNNSGKSSILECLRARSGNQNISFTTGTRNAFTEEVEIKFTINESEEVIKSRAKGSSETIKIGVNKSFEIFVVPSRRAFNPYFNRNQWTREQFIDFSVIPSQRSAVMTNFEARLFNILENPTQFNILLKEVLGFEPSWTIDQSDQGQYFLKFFNGTSSHSSDGMGEGITSLFAIVDALYDSKPGNVVVIDEPELSLHPGLQKRLAKLLRRFASDRQIVISTHSPYFIDLQALAVGGTLARVISTKNGTRIFELSLESKNAIKKLSNGNLYNPHVFGLDARELFFQEDRIILTEGQEDVLLFPRIGEQLDIAIPGNFFGWGVGGAGNVAYLCRILADLGFQKVAALLDGDKVDDCDRLAVDYPKYFFGCIPAKDIRTKPPREASDAVDGLLDKKLEIKPEFYDSMSDLLKSVSTHMNS